tara:strand:- start:1756 stop:1968 length:213 start_codon:yes stop_codon:yes gene_type:complete
MKIIIFSDHAEKRRKQRGLSPLDIGEAIDNAKERYKQKDGTTKARGKNKGRKITLIYLRKENYIRIVTIY